MSKSIPFIFLLVYFILISNSNFAQKYSPDHHWFYTKPDSIMSDSMFFSRDTVTQHFENVLKTYTFGESIHSNYNTALLLAHKELSEWSQELVNIHLELNESTPEIQRQKFNLIVKKTIIELLDDGKYHVVLWGKYEVYK